MMKTTFLGALALGLSCSLASAQPAQKSEAQMLFDKCRAAYGALKTYRGTTKTQSVMLFNGAEIKSGGTATATFQQPNLLRFDGKLAGMMRGDFSVLGNEAGGYYRWPLENEGDWKKADGLNMAIAAMTGVSGGTLNTIAGLLMPATGGNPFRLGDEAKLDGEELIDGQTCTKVTARPASETISWFIDKKTLMLRRVAESYDEKQSAARLAEIDKQNAEADKKAGREPAPKFDLRLVSKTEDLKVDEFNGAVDSRLFSTVGALWPYKPEG